MASLSILFSREDELVGLINDIDSLTDPLLR